MILSFSAKTPQGQIRHFSIVCDDLGLCLDVLSLAITLGDTLLGAELTEAQGTPLPLPLKAFDTNQVSQYLRALQMEWERILA